MVLQGDGFEVAHVDLKGKNNPELKVLIKLEFPCSTVLP